MLLTELMGKKSSLGLRGLGRYSADVLFLHWCSWLECSFSLSPQTFPTSNDSPEAWNHVVPFETEKYNAALLHALLPTLRASSLHFPRLACHHGPSSSTGTTALYQPLPLLCSATHSTEPLRGEDTPCHILVQRLRNQEEEHHEAKGVKWDGENTWQAYQNQGGNSGTDGDVIVANFFCWALTVLKTQYLQSHILPFDPRVMLPSLS